MGKKGDANNPQFELKSGVVLTLKPLPNVILQRWLSEWMKKNRQPLPPKYQASNGEWYDDTDNENFTTLLGIWAVSYNDAQKGFCLRLGVVDQPPSDWTPIYPIWEDDLRMNWLYTLMADEDEIEAITKAIMGLANATQAGVEAAQKNSA